MVHATDAAEQSVACTICASGSHDDDGDPATPCAALAGCLQECEPGFDDHDCDEDTACVQCDAGTYSAGGARTVGTQSLCANCTAGRVDDDSDATTACLACPAGTQSPDGVVCEPCSPGEEPNAAQDGCVSCGAIAPNLYSDDGRSCRPCSHGSEPNAVQRACIPCGPRGRAGVFGVCDQCDAGKEPGKL